MKHILYGLAVFLIFVLACGMCASPVRAQQVTLSISPPIIESVIKPGKSIVLGFTFQNLGDPTAMSVKIRTFSPKGDYGEMAIDADAQSPIRFSLENTDFKFDEPFFMRQRDMKQAVVRVRIPDNTPEGDYYFVFLAETEPVPSVGGSSVPLAKASVGSTLLITVSETGMTEVKSRIVLFSVKPDFTLKLFNRRVNIVESGSQIPIRLIIQNQGKNLIKPQGSIILRGGMGEKFIYPLLPQNILIDSNRLIKATGGAPTTKPDVSLLISGFYIGSYSLSANVSFGENTPSLYANAYFIALPIRFLIVLVAVILISLTVIKLMKRNKK